MKRRKAALYDPYLDVLGGGEKYWLSMLKVLESLGYEPTIFWDKDFSNKIKKTLNISFNSAHFESNIFRDKTLTPFQRFLKLREYDIFLYMTDGSYFFSGAKKNIVYAMVPLQSLYDVSMFNKLKHFNWEFITHSYFTQQHLEKWGIHPKVLYPYLEDDFIHSPHLEKKPIILSVGRFFGQLHSKNHEKMIDVFLSDKTVPQKFTLVLAGGLKDEDKDYLTRLQKKVKGKGNIQLQPNISYKELLKLYQDAMFYWHFAGFGIDEERHPELVEHFGITPLEAMAHGCIVFCYNAGGPKELIRDGGNGFLFSSEKELLSKLKTVLESKEGLKEIPENARDFIQKNFDYETYKESLIDVLGIEN